VKITLSKGAGFCPGVKRADIEIRRLISEKAYNERIYTLGSLIHNRGYTEELSALGITVIE